MKRSLEFFERASMKKVVTTFARKMLPSKFVSDYGLGKIRDLAVVSSNPHDYWVANVALKRHLTSYLLAFGLPLKLNEPALNTKFFIP